MVNKELPQQPPMAQTLSHRTEQECTMHSTAQTGLLSVQVLGVDDREQEKENEQSCSHHFDITEKEQRVSSALLPWPAGADKEPFRYSICVPLHIPHFLALGTICSSQIPLGRQTSLGKQKQKPKHTQYTAHSHTAEATVGKSRQ